MERKKIRLNTQVKTAIAVLFIGMFFSQSATAQKAGAVQRITIADFKPLTGTWKGQLTYLDYTSNKTVSMEANTLFEMVSDSSFDQFIYYSTEPNKNADSRYTIRENGRVLNEMKLVERKEKKGKLLLVFEYRGPDGNDNRMATMQSIMELSGKVLTITKMVKYDGENLFIQRHQYRFTSVM